MPFVSCLVLRVISVLCPELCIVIAQSGGLQRSSRSLNARALVLQRQPARSQALLCAENRSQTGKAQHLPAWAHACSFATAARRRASCSVRSRRRCACGSVQRSSCSANALPAGVPGTRDVRRSPDPPELPPAAAAMPRARDATTAQRCSGCARRACAAPRSTAASTAASARSRRSRTATAAARLAAARRPAGEASWYGLAQGCRYCKR